MKHDGMKTRDICLIPLVGAAAVAEDAGLAILLWLFMLAIGHQPGAVAAMHALQG